MKWTSLFFAGLFVPALPVGFAACSSATSQGVAANPDLPTGEALEPRPGSSGDPIRPTPEVSPVPTGLDVDASAEAAAPVMSVCTSGKNWTSGDHGSPIMHPGGACLTCHAQNPGAPDLVVGGTVFPTLHEPIDCDGAKGVTVVVTDAMGVDHTATTNVAGNFLFDFTENIPMPIHAKIQYNGKERAMVGARMTGNCNSCHTEDGDNGAPGRIALP